MSADYVILGVAALIGLGSGLVLLFQAKRYRKTHSRDLGAHSR